MGYRILVGLLSIYFCIFASHANALGLGDITLKTALNEPLVAEIKLLQVRELQNEEIIVELASNEDFERIGVDRTFFLTGLQFTVDVGAKDGPKIIVTSKNPVREPFLNFVITTEWPSGKLLREYTLLMDLPVFSEEKRSQPVSSTTSYAAPNESSVADVKSGGVSNPRSSFGQQSSAGESQSYSGPRYDGDTYAVKPNDTLWEIAEEIRPSGSVTVHQTMIALQDANPNAFINNNINLLKSGQILRIPTESEIQSNSLQGAIQQVAAQNREWTGAGPQLNASRSTNEFSSETSEPEGRLKLSAPEDVYSSSEGRSSGGDSDFSVNALENELSATMEQLDKAQRENSDLRSEVASLEEQMETLESMLQVANESLRALELSAQKSEQEKAAREAEVEALDESSVSDLYSQNEPDVVSDTTSEIGTSDEELYPDTVTGDEVVVADEELIGAETNEFGGDEELLLDQTEDSLDSSQDVAVVATPEPVKEKPAPKVVRQAPKPESSIFSMIMDNILYIVLGIFALLGAAYYFVRSRNNDDEFDDFLSTVDTSEPLEDDDNTVIQNREPEFDEPLEPLPDLEDADDKTVVQDEEQHGEQQTEDVVAEADIYIAYGKYDQAEDMLVSAIDKSPQDENVLVKLLEVYSIQEKITDFDNRFGQLRQFGSDESIERAEKLRSGIAGIPDFDEETYTGEQPAISHDFDSSDETMVNEALESESDLEFTLDVPESSLDSEEKQEDDLNFDLDIDESTTENDLDFDISDTNLEDDLQENDFELDLSEDLSLDIDDEDKTQIKPLEDAIESSDEVIEEADSLEGIEFDLDDVALESKEDEESLTFDFDTNEETESSSDSDDLLSLDLGSSDDLEIEGTEVELDLSDSDLDLDGVIEEEQPEESVLEDETPIQFASEDSDQGVETGLTEAFEAAGDDELDLGSDADLSALDEELDELTSEMGDLDELDLDIELESDEPEDLAKSDTPLAEGLDSDVYNLDLESEADSSEDLPTLEPLAGEPVLQEELLSGDEITQAGEEIDFDEDDFELGSDLDDGLEMEEAIPELEASELGEDLDIEEPVVDFDSSEDEAHEAPVLEPETPSSFELEDSVPSIPGVETSFDALEDESSEEVDIDSLESGNTGEFEFELPEIDPDADDDDSDLDFLSDSDETATKLDLARAYIDMGDANGAKDILREVLKEGNDQQKLEAEGLMGRVDSHA